MATAPPPMPPEVSAQQDPNQARAIFAANGVGQPQPGMAQLQALQAKIPEFESWLKQVITMAQQVQPGLIAHLSPIAVAIKAFRDGLEETAQRSGLAQGSPVMPGPPAQNPAAGPQNQGVV